MDFNWNFLKNRLLYLECCLFKHRKAIAHIYAKQIDIESWIITFDIENRRQNKFDSLELKYIFVNRTFKQNVTNLL